MPASRTPNPELSVLDDPDAAPFANESVQSVTEAERKAHLEQRLNEAELELLIQASALRIQGLVLTRSASEDEAEIA